jgi:hypothetical protein
MGYARDLVRPNLLLFQWMVGDAFRKEMLKESHVLKAEKRNLVVRLPKETVVSDGIGKLSVHTYLMCYLW